MRTVPRGSAWMNYYTTDRTMHTIHPLAATGKNAITVKTVNNP